LEKEYRRDSDALQRAWLADRLQRSKPALDTYGRALVDAKKLDALTQLDHFKSRLDKTISRLRGAMQGYSGFFDLVQVNEAVLDRVYEQDMKTMDAVEHLAAAIEKLASTTADAPAPIADLNNQLAQVDQAIDHRQDILRGLE
jgi:methyl-accepting chemotaxis protein